MQFLGANGELSAACMKSTVLNVTEIGMKARAGSSSKPLFSIPASALLAGKKKWR